LYHNDQVTALKGVGKSTATKLKICQIFLIADVNSITDEYIRLIVDETGLPTAKISDMMAQMTGCLDEGCPDQIDYCTSDNPYQAHYREDWEHHVKASNFMKNSVCISDEIEHILSETGRVFKGTTHKHDCIFYHDALSQMTIKDCITWMQGYYNLWILPENGL
jgi:hypothetical protein